MKDDVKEHVSGCPRCQWNSFRRHRPYGELVPLPMPKRVMSQLSMDFITGLPPVWWQGAIVDSILVIVDRLSKMCFFFAVSTDMDASELAELFHREIELHYGPAESIVSDRGSLFTSKFWKSLMTRGNTKLRLSTAFHPATDGQTERMNQTLENYLRCFIQDAPHNWPSLLQEAHFAVNIQKSATTGFAPFEMILPYIPSFVIPASQQQHTRDRVESLLRRGDDVPAAQIRIDKLQALRDKCSEHWKRAVETMERNFNKKRQPMSFNVGQWVLLRSRNLRLKGSPKLWPRYIGPFRVLQRIGSRAYRLGLPEKYSRVHNVFNVESIEPWVARQGEDPASIRQECPDLEGEQEEWEIEDIRDKREDAGVTYYLVKWANWPAEYSSWEPEDNLENARRAVAAFERGRGARKRGVAS